MNEIELKNKVQRAQRANELLNDPLMQEFIISVRGDLLHAFETCEDSDDKRKTIWSESQAFNRLMSRFQKELREGKNARTTLEENSKAKIKNII